MLPPRTCETVASVFLVVPPGGSFRETRHVELGARVLTIGRAAGCDVRVDVPGVDDEHAKISEVALVAIGSDCAIGDVPLDAGQRRLVMAGDEIQIGSVVLAVGAEQPVHAANAPTIRVVEGKNFGDELVLAAENREYVIGRNPSADLVLEDREVSREHIKLVRRGMSVFIYDAASTRGSWLGRSAVYQGSRVEWQRPRMLKLGASVLALDVPGAVGQTAMGQASAPMTPPPRLRAPSQRPPATGGSQPPGPLYEAKPPPRKSAPPPAGSVPPPAPEKTAAPSDEVGISRHRPKTERTAWKKSGPTVGRGLGMLLLALAALAILGVLFVVFSIME